MNKTPTKGDRYTSMGCQIEVRRVAKDGTWADIFVYQVTNRYSWTKRQRLPFPATFIRNTQTEETA